VQVQVGMIFFDASTKCHGFIYTSVL
jgi:hypothetical protein